MDARPSVHAVANKVCVWEGGVRAGSVCGSEECMCGREVYVQCVWGTGKYRRKLFIMDARHSVNAVPNKVRVWGRSMRACGPFGGVRCVCMCLCVAEREESVRAPTNC